MTADETKRALVAHQPDGEHYVIEYVAIWNETGDKPLGTQIIGAVGPLHYLDYNAAGEGPLMESREQFNLIDQFAGLTDEDAGWLQAEEDAGRLTYPIGVR
jgi:hypothetical protein